NPEVEREKILLETQAEKRLTEEALRRGDEDAARRHLASSMSLLQSAPQDAEIDEEMLFLNRTMEELDRRGSRYTEKRLRADGSKKSRGYKTREQGGQIDDPGEESA
ncbi:MAG: hypothetical protein KDC40_16550, partial [Actinobacteria bacterium]|nr:hypothetical protein [Actinomycetota bacterium]